MRDVSPRPFDPKRPRVGRDAASQPLIRAVVEPVPAAPGQPERFDSESIRNGTAHRFRSVAPLLGWRHGEGTERRTAKDFATVVRWIVADRHPDAEQVVLVRDHRNTPQLASLSEAFEPAWARRIAAWLEVPSPPTHGRGLNLAAIEWSVRARPGRDRRIGTRGEWQREVVAGEGQRNGRGVVIQGRFTTADARIKLRRLYPPLQ